MGTSDASPLVCGEEISHPSAFTYALSKRFFFTGIDDFHACDARNGEY